MSQPLIGKAEVSVVLPVYRTRAAAAELHQRLVAALEPTGRRFELVFVDDACPERTRELLVEMARNDPRIRVLAMPRNVGQQQAVREGLRRANGEVVVVMDADLQDPPEAIPMLLDELDGRAAVFATRAGPYEPRSRLFTSRLFKAALAALTSVPRGAGGFVAMDRRMIDALLAMDGSHPYLVGMIGVSGLPIGGVSVAREPRRAGRSSYSNAARLKMALAGIAGLRAWRRQARRRSGA